MFSNILKTIIFLKVGKKRIPGSWCSKAFYSCSQPLLPHVLLDIWSDPAGLAVLVTDRGHMFVLHWHHFILAVKQNFSSMKSRSSLLVGLLTWSWIVQEFWSYVLKGKQHDKVIYRYQSSKSCEQVLLSILS